MAKIQHLSQIQSTGESWVIDGVLSGLSLLWGKPGLGKSFVAISMVASVGSGRPWLGRHVQEGRVVYVAGEGGSEAVARRIRAALAAWDVDPAHEEVPIDIVTPGVDLTAGVDEIISLIGGPPPRLIVVDTLSRCFVGDENSQEYMGKFVRSLDSLRDIYGCCVLVIHHATKGDTGEARGSSVLTGAVDVNWKLLRKKGDAAYRPYSMVAEKLRERDTMGSHIRFVTSKVACYDIAGKLELDTFGDTQTSLIVKPDPKDLETAKRVLGVGEALLVAEPELPYADWRIASCLDKADFDAALSIIVTYPGQWGGIEQLRPGMYGRSS